MGAALAIAIYLADELARLDAGPDDLARIRGADQIIDDRRPVSCETSTPTARTSDAGDRSTGDRACC